MYSAVFVKNLRQMLTYRSEFLIGIIGNILYVYVQVCIWRALLGTGMGGNVSLPQMVTYVIIAFVLKGMTNSSISYILADKVKTGSIAMDMIRPIHLIGYMFAEQMSSNCFSVFANIVPTVIIAVLAWGFLPAPSLVYLLLFLVSVVLAVGIMFYIDYITGLFTFWLKNGTYSDFITGGLFTVFSGSAIPLWFYPDWLRNIAEFLPFRFVAFSPIQIYLGNTTVLGALNILALQMVWLVVLFVAERAIWKRAQTLVFVQGG